MVPVGFAADPEFPPGASTRLIEVLTALHRESNPDVPGGGTYSGAGATISVDGKYYRVLSVDTKAGTANVQEVNFANPNAPPATTQLTSTSLERARNEGFHYSSHTDDGAAWMNSRGTRIIVEGVAYRIVGETADKQGIQVQPLGGGSTSEISKAKLKQGATVFQQMYETVTVTGNQATFTLGEVIITPDGNDGEIKRFNPDGSVLLADRNGVERTITAADYARSTMPKSLDKGDHLQLADGTSVLVTEVKDSGILTVQLPNGGTREVFSDQLQGATYQGNTITKFEGVAAGTTITDISGKTYRVVSTADGKLNVQELGPDGKPIAATAGSKTSFTLAEAQAAGLHKKVTTPPRIGPSAAPRTPPPTTQPPGAQPPTPTTPVANAPQPAKKDFDPSKILGFGPNGFDKAKLEAAVKGVQNYDNLKAEYERLNKEVEELEDKIKATTDPDEKKRLQEQLERLEVRWRAADDAEEQAIDTIQEIFGFDAIEKGNPYFEGIKDEGFCCDGYKIKNAAALTELLNTLQRSKTTAVPGVLFDPVTTSLIAPKRGEIGFEKDIVSVKGVNIELSNQQVGLAFKNGKPISAFDGKEITEGSSFETYDKSDCTSAGRCTKRMFNALANPGTTASARSAAGGGLLFFSEGGIFESSQFLVALPGQDTQTVRPVDIDDKAITINGKQFSGRDVLEANIRYQGAIENTLDDLEYDNFGNLKDPNAKVTYKDIEGNEKTVSVRELLATSQQSFETEVQAVTTARDDFLKGLSGEALNTELEKRGISKAEYEALKTTEDLDTLVARGVITEQQRSELCAGIDDCERLSQVKNTQLTPKQQAERQQRIAEKRAYQQTVINIRKTIGVAQVAWTIGAMQALVAAGNRFSGIGAVASLFIEDDDIYGIKEEVHQAFCDSVVFADESCRAQQFCEITPDHISGGQAVLIGGTVNSFQATAHIQGYVYPPVIEQTETTTGRQRFHLERLYQITYSIQLGAEERDAYNIVFRGPLGATRMFTSDQSLDKGGSASRGRSNPFIRYSKNLYDEVCITFNKGVEDYTGARHKSLCTPVVAKTGRAPDPVQNEGDQRKRDRGENPNI